MEGEGKVYRWTTSGVCWVSGERYTALNAQLREFCGVTEGVDKRIDEGVLRWFVHVERMENDRIAKRLYVGECAGSRIVGLLQKWMVTVKDCFKKKIFGFQTSKENVG